jgi:uncharacterized membrane protein
VTSLVILCIWLLAWEIAVAPLHPGGSLLALKALPLLLPLRGVIKRDLYTLQWSSMVILIYFVEGAVRAWSDKTDISRLMALGEVMLVFAYFAFALLYLRPYKKQAQKLAKELLDKVKVPHD